MRLGYKSLVGANLNMSRHTEVHYSGPRPIFYVPSYFLLGQVYERKGDTRLAIENYRKFLEFWKTADKDLVLLEDATRHLAGLESSTIQ